nr:hypothetical protein [Chloroflexota bacterium]
VQEFLVIGVTSGVRRSLEIAVGSSATPEAGHPVAPSSRDVVIDLGINALGVLVLVIALWLVRQVASAPAQRHPPDASDALL